MTNTQFLVVEQEDLLEIHGRDIRGHGHQLLIELVDKRFLLVGDDLDGHKRQLDGHWMVVDG